MRARVVLPLAVAGGLVAAALVWRRPSPAPAATRLPTVQVLDRLPPFEGPELDPTRWARTQVGDLIEPSVDLAQVPGSDPRRYRLRLRAATRGSSGTVMKILGVRSVPSVSLDGETLIAADLDWNPQQNGSYLSAALILSPVQTNGDPLQEADWLKVEYIGVPPGKNARMVIAARNGGQERLLFDEGWPRQNREGRPMGLEKIELVFQSGSFRIVENDQVLYQSSEKAVGFGTAHLYLQMSSGPNYPSREITFDRVRWSHR